MPMQTPNPKDSVFTGRVLSAMANEVSSQLVAFSSWMLLGFGAILGFVIAHIDTASKFIAPDAMGTAVKFFMVALIFNVFQRYLASMVAGSVAIGKEVEAFPVPGDFNIQSFSQELEKSTLWPMKIMVRWSNKCILAGDIAVGGRLNARLAQIQAWFVLVEVLAVLGSALVIANALQG